MDKINIILCGKQNRGKTTTLIELVKLLVNNPSVSAAIDATLRTRTVRFKDARIIVDIDDRLILVATGG